MATIVEIEDEYPLALKSTSDEFGDPVVVIAGAGLLSSIWLSTDEARELVKALKKHIKKAEGK